MNTSAGMATSADGHTHRAFEFEVVQQAQRGLSRGELLRKFLHMSPGFIPFLMKDLPHLDPLDRASLIFLCAVSVILTVIFLAVFRLVRRPGEDNLLSTVVSYPACIVGAMLLFPAHLEFACVVVIILAFGDGCAYLCGHFLGRTPLPWNPRKTWLGTLGFISVSGPVAALSFWLEAKPEVPVLTAAACGMSAAIAGAIAESLNVRITDNLRVGVAALIAVAVTNALLT